MTLRATEYHVRCGACGYRMEWVPQVGRMDAGSGPSFRAFTTEIDQPDGSSKSVEVTSLHQLRQIERASHQAAANGEGRPMTFRAWSQSRGNLDVPTTGPPPSQRPDPEFVRRHGQALREGLGADLTQPDQIALGPGVTEGAMSALGDD